MANTLNLGNGNWATKEDSLLAYNSENNNYKPLPFDFTRASSATVVNKAGLIETVGSGEPRIDFSDDVNGALLLEPQRSNLILNSQALSLSPIKNGTFTDNFAISPDGTQNASKFTAPNSDPYFYQSFSFAAATYSASIYVKGIGSSIGKDFRIVIGSNTTTPKLIIPSEWTRFEYTATMPSGSANTGLEIADPAVVGDEVLLWGWQVEQGSYATSYIPTSGSAVTRVGDVCSNGGNDQVINSTEGVLYVEANLIDGYDNNNFLATIFDNSNGGGNHILIQRYLGKIQAKIKVGTTQAEITEPNATSGNKKIAFTYKANEFKMFVNGSQVGLTDTSGSVFSPNTLDKINVGSYYNSALNFNNGVKDVRVYNTALTDNELIALTTI